MQILIDQCYCKNSINFPNHCFLYLFLEMSRSDEKLSWLIECVFIIVSTYSYSKIK